MKDLAFLSKFIVIGGGHTRSERQRLALEIEGAALGHVTLGKGARGCRFYSRLAFLAGH